MRARVKLYLPPGWGAFSLTELMIVVVMVGVLTLSTAPMWMSQMRRNLATEAQAALEAIYQGERAWFSEKDEYLALAAGEVGNGADDARPGLGLVFRGNIYYGPECFTVALDDTYGFVARCDGGAAGNSAPKASTVSDVRCEMRGTGEWRLSTDGGSTWSGWK